MLRWYKRFLCGNITVTSNMRDSVSNHQPHDCLLNRLFRGRSKKISKLRVTGLCAGSSPGTGEFPAQMASNAENVSIWWRNHDLEMHFSQIWKKNNETIPYRKIYLNISSWKGHHFVSPSKHCSRNIWLPFQISPEVINEIENVVLYLLWNCTHVNIIVPHWW